MGGGFGSHFWFTHTRGDNSRISQMRVTGTWSLNRDLNQWARVLAHLPDTGAETPQAKYTIGLGDGTTRTRYLNQDFRSNKWVSLGTYQFKGTPKVGLANETADGTADQDVAWDAIAFQPLPDTCSPCFSPPLRKMCKVIAKLHQRRRSTGRPWRWQQGKVVPGAVDLTAPPTGPAHAASERS